MFKQKQMFFQLLTLLLKGVIKTVHALLQHFLLTVFVIQIPDTIY